MTSLCTCAYVIYVHMCTWQMPIVEFQLKNLVKMRDSTIVQSSVCAVFLKKSTDFTIGVARSILVLSPLSLALWLSGSLTPWRRRHRCRVPVADMWLHRQEGLADWSRTVPVQLETRWVVRTRRVRGKNQWKVMSRGQQLWRWIFKAVVSKWSREEEDGEQYFGQNHWRHAMHCYNIEETGGWVDWLAVTLNIELKSTHQLVPHQVWISFLSLTKVKLLWILVLSSRERLVNFEDISRPWNLEDELWKQTLELGRWTLQSSSNFFAFSSTSTLTEDKVMMTLTIIYEEDAVDADDIEYWCHRWH